MRERHGVFGEGIDGALGVFDHAAHQGPLGGAVKEGGGFVHAAAKAGILGLTRSLAKELGPKVSVNAICPGIIATDLLRGLLSHREAELTAGIAMGRVGTPEDVASIVRYLAVEAHMFMTGQHFVVDGFQWSC